MIKGNGVSKGIGFGNAIVLKNAERKIGDFKIANIEDELKLLESALNKVIEDTNKLIEKLSGQEKEIMSGHLMILQDETLLEETKRLIKEERWNVGYAVEHGFNSVIKMFEAIDDEYLAGRSRDIADIKNRVLGKILNEVEVNLNELPKDTIIVTSELTTSDTAKLDYKNISGIITEVGGENSHTSIIARTHEIPSVSGVSGITNIINNGDYVAVNGITGEIFINPSEEELNDLKKKLKNFLGEKDGLENYRGVESKTLDGHHVEIVANIGNPKDAQIAAEKDAEGVGLFRSEFLYMDSENMPTEDEQFEAYKQAVEAMNGKQVIIRTLDIGGDKELKYLKLEKEANPFLGVRAIRLCLNNVELFKTQLRALLRASNYGNLAIMFPMISSIEELRSAKEVVDECKKELDNLGISYNKDIKVGIMIEIPSSALNAKALAKECDFFSIGTNDLIQYTVAVERGNEKIAHLYSKFNPAVIKLIKMAIEGAHESGIFCGMCGESAGSEEYIPLLLGLGLDEFSMSSNNILKARKIINNLKLEECQKLAEEILEMSSATEVENKLKEFQK